MTKELTKTKTFWETCDLWDICSEGWEDMTRPKKLTNTNKKTKTKIMTKTKTETFKENLNLQGWPSRREGIGTTWSSGCQVIIAKISTFTFYQVTTFHNFSQLCFTFTFCQAIITKISTFTFYQVTFCHNFFSTLIHFHFLPGYECKVFS